MNTVSTYVIIKKCLFSQIGIGIIANNFLLLFRIITLLHGKPKTTDLTTSHLALIHIIMLLNAVFLVSPDVFESLNFRNDVKCKVFFYIGRVMRGLSICTTCLLSVLQAITISLNTSWLVKFKHKSTSFIFSLLFFFWFFCLIFGSNIIFYTMASSNVTQRNVLIVSKYCSLSSMKAIIWRLIFILTTSRDVFFVGIMLLASVYMVILLSRHQRQSQYLHSSSLSARVSPEQRATQTILLLVSSFVVMYWVDFIISSSSLVLWVYDPVIFDIQSFVVNIYATVSPFVLMNQMEKEMKKVSNYIAMKNGFYL
ncbi:putative vomeronasal receptor-like protein 4 [Orycteropus afer afer]|uniref:Vomeronasal receptor-like protein 4 n=1 Tax=Orycteropus afer afer TaxID=1230840 RepID=A0AC54ZDW5_ORYAF|nr:putative vomeronasal receptor-like protein 4 [Orycteropus afer afer]